MTIEPGGVVYCCKENQGRSGANEQQQHGCCFKNDIAAATGKRFRPIIGLDRFAISSEAK